MADQIGPHQPYPLTAALAFAIYLDNGSDIGIHFWAVSPDKNGDLAVGTLYLDTTGMDDPAVVQEAIRYFSPMYKGGARVCIVNGISIVALDIDLAKRVDPIADYDRAMAIVGRK